MMPLAPGLFSTTTGCEIERESCSAVKRARVSVTPPGGHGTIILIALWGYCARTGRAAPSNTAPRPSNHLRLLFMASSLGSQAGEALESLIVIYDPFNHRSL